MNTWNIEEKQTELSWGMSLAPKQLKRKLKFQGIFPNFETTVRKNILVFFHYNRRSHTCKYLSNGSNSLTVLETRKAASKI